MSSEMRGRGGGNRANGGGGGGGFDPSNLHLKKELNQIRKAARVLRDPGTTSSWRSPLNSARSAAAKHYYHHHKNDFSKQLYSNGETQFQLPIGTVENNGTSSRSINYEASNGNNVKEKEKEKEKKVYLYNWKMQKSESERSRQCADDDLENVGNDDMEQSSSAQEEAEESVEDSLSDARNGGIDSKSDTYASDKYASMIFKCKDTSFTPSIRRNIKKKSKKSNYCRSNLRSRGEKLKEQILLARGSKRTALEGLGRDDLSSLVDQSDDTESYCNSEDLRRASAVSPLLAKLKNKNWSNSSAARFLRSSRKEDSSYSYSTPAMSASSYNRYVARYPSTVGSWDATTVSLNDGDEEGDDPLDLPGRSGCGIPCYWSRRSTPKYKGGSGSCFSPSLSDTLRRTGSTILCGSHRMYKRSCRGSSLGYNKRRPGSRPAPQGLLPLLTNGGDGRIGSSIGTGNSDDELSTNYGELDLEALSRLDGRRWSTSCRSQEGLELVALTGEEEGTPENITSLSQKYRPMFFEELIGQNIVVQSLMTAVSRKRIAPIYLFQGPRGTGKTSTARVFAAALNCLASEETKPCGVCRECADFVSGKSRDLVEVDGANKKGIDSIRYLLKVLLAGSLSASSRYKVFVVNECHLLPAKTWMGLLKFLEEPPPHVVLILITTDLDNVPRTVLSRCQKYPFNKIRDGDILARLRKIAVEENLDVESDALDLIALNADGSLRDAETMLDQLSLLGKRITTSLVNELVGVISDEKLLELLELAMSSDTAETVKRGRDLMDSGVDPIVLMSQMATLIMDIISGTYPTVDAKQTTSLFGGRNLTEAELERLKRALKLLSEAEKQLRVSSERSTWFTATLLQLGSISSPDQTHSGSSRRQSSKATEEDYSSTLKDSSISNQKPDRQYTLRNSVSPPSFHKATYQKSNSKEASLPVMDVKGLSPNPSQNQLISGDALAGTCDDFVAGINTSRCTASSMLDDIWVKCVEKCHSKTLRQLLHTYGRLVSIADVEGVFVAYIAFGDSDIKTRAERFHSSITNSFETVLRSNVEVRIVLLPDGDTYLSNANPDISPVQKPTHATNNLNRENAAVLSSSADGYSNIDTCQESLKISRGSFNNSEDKLPANLGSSAGNAKMGNTKDRKPEVPVQRIESIIHEQRLETAWLQAMEKGTPGTTNRLRPEKNQVLPQEGIYHHIQLQSSASADLSSQHWEDELSRDIKSLKVDDGKALKKDQISKRVDHYPISPSLLHDNNIVGNFSKDNLGYESGPGGGSCSGLFCWNNTKVTKPPRRVKVKQGTPVRSNKAVRFSWFGECAKASRTESRFKI
ncbi:protein STICHEL [Coffea eugenioides]|uniref:protein STICHEL n=1 Tax=Coffea eugenioides TaxID=49369 RepID=UPI000F60A9D2|nr:protein STICHEL [Coffea eugenioides]